MRRIYYAAAALLLLLGVPAGVCVWYIETGRLAAEVRARIVTELERSTGGKAEIGAFHFDWRTITAEVDHTVIHGTEPASSIPLFSADRIFIRFRIASLVKRQIDLVSVSVESPRVHLAVAEDGSTNIPDRRRSGVSSLLDLRIGRFDARAGLLLADVNGKSASQPWSARGHDLIVSLDYDSSGRQYRGFLSCAPLRVSARGIGSMDLDADTQITINRDRILISRADLKSAGSEFRLTNVIISNFAAPVVTARYTANISPGEFATGHGSLQTSGDLRFASPSNYEFTASARAEHFSFGPFRNVSATASLHAVPDLIELSNIHASSIEGRFVGAAEVSKLQKFNLNGRLEHVQARRAIETLAHKSIEWDAWLSGPFRASGRIADIRQGHIVANGRLTATPVDCARCVPVNGQIDAKFDGITQTIEFSRSSISLPSTQLTFSGVFGRNLTVEANTRDLNDFRPAIGKWNQVFLKEGSASFAGTVAGPLEDPSLAGHVTVTNLLIHDQKLDSFSGDIAARRSSISLARGSVVQGTLRARASGTLALSDWRPTNESAIDANLQVSGADLKTLFAAAGAKDLEFSGSGRADAHVAGTIGEPRLNASATLMRGTLYGQPYDSLNARVQYQDSGAQLFNVVFASAAKRVKMTGEFHHTPGAPPLAGELSFNAQSNAMALNQIALIRARQPDLHGLAQFHSEGAARIRRNSAGELTFDLLRLNGDASASRIELAGRNLGDARLSADTKGDVLNVHLDSNAAQASIHVSGAVSLAPGYPVNASATFSGAGLNALATLIARPEQAGEIDFDGTAAGEVAVRGSLEDWRRLSGSITVPQFEIYSLAAPGNCGEGSACAGIRNFRLRNSGPLRFSLAGGILSVENAHFIGPQTDIKVSGNMGFTERAGYNLRAEGDVNLALGSTFAPELETGGDMHVNAALRGALNAPDLSGRMEIRNGSVRYSGFANGITSVNAALVFNGSRATIQNFSGESGGGRVDVGGFAALTGGLIAFRLDAKTTGVRLRFAEGVSVVSDSHVTVAGTSERSEAAGTVLIHRVTINPRADFSSIFARSAQPVKTPTVQAGILSKLNLDVQISTAPDVALETSVAQRIEADANLRLRGTATNPTLLGRVNITSGELMFFGNKYTITTGSVSFLNPSRIDPVLNVDLETRARGVEVILTIAGPITKPSVSYRSDPPLQFSDIVALLATGRSPYDPGLPGGTVGQQQAFAQLGASQLIGEAIQNPASGRLQRFFGVSKVKIDPQLTDVTGSPESRLTIEQQVTPDILFTYITDVSSTSTQLIQVEWAFNRNWSAIVTREENGYVGLDFAYRKRFR